MKINLEASLMKSQPFYIAENLGHKMETKELKDFLHLK